MCAAEGVLRLKNNWPHEHWYLFIPVYKIVGQYIHKFLYDQNLGHSIIQVPLKLNFDKQIDIYIEINHYIFVMYWKDRFFLIFLLPIGIKTIYIGWWLSDQLMNVTNCDHKYYLPSGCTNTITQLRLLRHILKTWHGKTCK